MCRSIYPGLNIDRKLLPDGLLRGLWRGIDADASGNVTVQEFMVFMRAHAAHLDSMAGYTHRMHELASTQKVCLLYTSPSPRDATLSRMPSSA